MKHRRRTASLEWIYQYILAGRKSWRSSTSIFVVKRSAASGMENMIIEEGFSIGLA